MSRAFLLGAALVASWLPAAARAHEEPIVERLRASWRWRQFHGHEPCDSSFRAMRTWLDGGLTAADDTGLLHGDGDGREWPGLALQRVTALTERLSTLTRGLFDAQEEERRLARARRVAGRHLQDRVTPGRGNRRAGFDTLGTAQTPAGSRTGRGEGWT